MTSIDGLVDLTFQDESTGFAIAQRPDCAAAILATNDRGQGWRQTACLRGQHANAIASNESAARVIVQVDKTTRHSEDNAATWQSAS